MAHINLYTLSPSKRLWQEYKTLNLNMVVDNGSVETTKVNYELLCDVETLLGFVCILFMLELVQGLSKFTQR
jgi:hypothetical protein